MIRKMYSRLVMRLHEKQHVLLLYIVTTGVFVVHVYYIMLRNINYFSGRNKCIHTQ